MLVAWLYLIVLKFLGVVIRAQRQIPGPNYGNITAPPRTPNEKMNSGAALWMQAEITQINVKLERLLYTHGVILGIQDN